MWDRGRPPAAERTEADEGARGPRGTIFGFQGADLRITLLGLQSGWPGDRWDRGRPRPHSVSDCSPSIQREFRSSSNHG